MKKVLLVFICLFSLSFSFSSSWEWTPDNIVYDLKWPIQDTAVDKSLPGQGNGIKESLGSLKKSSRWYIQWMWYIWLTAAFLLIIYNWIMILANFGDENKFTKSKKRFISLIIWVIVLTSAYFVIKVAVELVGWVFS